MGPPAQQNVTPPMKGVFPLDHLKECRKAELRYLACLKKHGAQAYHCTHLVKGYLNCRMNNELMKVEPLKNLGITESPLDKHRFEVMQAKKENKTTT